MSEISAFSKLIVYAFLGVLVCLTSYICFWFIIRPYKKRSYFQRFGKDVAVSPKFIPFLGDFKHMKEMYIDKGKFIGRFLRDLAFDFGKKSAFFAVMGMDDMLFINDVDMFTQFQKLVPESIDREPIDTTGFGRVGGTGGLGQAKTSEYWTERRAIMSKTIGINFSSRFIPIFTSHVYNEIKGFKANSTVNISEIANIFSFEIISHILFGGDVREQLDKVMYTTKNGDASRVNLYQCLMKISHDCSFAQMTPFNVFFPWLVHYNIGSENRRNTKNSDEFERVIKLMCTSSKDQNSVYNQVLASGLVDKETAYKDVMTFLFAGHETTSKSFCSAIYHLKRNPKVEAKLMAEINKVILEDGKFTAKDLTKIDLSGKLNDCEYLNYLVKEVLRHDPPAARSLGYIVKKPIKLGDIMIPKNQVVLLNMYASHFNEDQWKEPLKFIPERFDPSSDYFTTPDGANRHPLTYCPFTFGRRTCPGKALGTMELKTLIVYFMTCIDYEIDEATLANDDITYAMLSPFELNIKVKQVHI